MSLEAIKQQIKSEIKVDVSGKGTASIRATARLCDVADSSLIRAFQSAAQTPSKLAEMLIEHGFDPAALAKSGVPDLAVAICVKYYANPAYSKQHSTEQARLVDLAFSSVGARAWMREVTGWQETKIIEMPQQTKPPYLEAREIAEQIAWIENNISDKNISATLIQHAMSSINPVLLSQAAHASNPVLKSKTSKKAPEQKPNYVLPSGNYQPLENFFVNQRIPSEIKSAFDLEQIFSKHARLMSVIGSNILLPWYKDCAQMREALGLALLECNIDPDEYLVKPW